MLFLLMAKKKEKTIIGPRIYNHLVVSIEIDSEMAQFAIIGQKEVIEKEKTTTLFYRIGCWIAIDELPCHLISPNPTPPIRMGFDSFPQINKAENKRV